MSTFKKLLALTLALAMVLSVSAFAGYSKDTYKDAANIDADCEEAIELMYALDIMTGDANGNFNPTATITRAEIVKMIYVILNYGNDDKAVNYKGANVFTDVVAGSWYEGYVTYAYMHKLVNGRGNGTFGPNDPVTTAEAAKMLLTAIGYSAEGRGYTGVNWAFNVLSDARILGLLDNYDFSTTGYAPRQWVAVMFENALGCYTFDTMKPTFSGLLISGEAETAHQTMGKKYYGLDEVTGVAIATYDAYIDGDKKADEYEVIVKDADGKLWQLRGTGLKVADLGQKYRVIFKETTSTKYDGTAYSVRSLSETAESRTLDMEVDVKYATDVNKAYNKYEFTVADMAATFEAYKVNVLYSGVNESATGAYETISVDELRAKINNDVNNNIWKAIDTDVDGKIDYFYVTEYDYAVVTDDDTHSKYGDYIYAEDLTSGDLEFNGEKRLYIEDCIISDDELVEDNFVKYTWSLDDGQYVMEVMDASEDVAYAARDAKKGIHELDGTDYLIADEADENADDVLVAANLGKDMDYVYDGDLIVYIIRSDSNFTDMADVNAQLVLVLDVMDEYSNSKIREQDAIEYMTIDGETHIAAYQSGEKDCVDFDELVALSDVLDNTKRDDDKSDWLGKDEENTYAIERRLFILHEGTKGRVYLEALNELKVNEQLDASTTLLDGYAVYGDGRAADGKLDATGTTVKLNGDKLAAGNSFFYGYFNSYGEAVYGVVTPEQLEKAYDNTAYAQVLTLDNERGTRTTVVGGYIFTPDMISDESDGYLFVDEILKETSKYYYRANVTLPDGTQKEITIDKDSIAAEDYAEGYLYAYDYIVTDDVYELTLVTVEDNNNEIVDFEDDYVIFEDKSELEMDDEVIAIVRVQVDRDENRDEFDFERNPFEYEIVEYKFIAVEDLTAEMIVDNEDGAEAGYVQFTDYKYRVDTYGDGELMYVVVWEVMDRYLGQDLTDSPLVCLLGQEVNADEISLSDVYVSAAEYDEDAEEPAESRFWLEITDVNYAYSIDLVLYSEDDEVLTYSSLNTEEYEPTGAPVTLTGNIRITGESDTWPAEKWTADVDEAPAYIEVIVDGISVGTADIDYQGKTWAEVMEIIWPTPAAE